MGDAVGYIVAAVVGALATILAVRVKFDLNDYLRDRRGRKAHRKCPHYHVEVMEGGKFFIDLWFESPTGTLDFFCHGCGLTTTRGGVDRVMRHARQEVLTKMKNAGIDTSSIKFEHVERDF